MNSKFVKSNKCGALLGVFMLLALIPSVAFAHFTITYYLDITTNWPGSVSFGWEQAQIKAYGRWGVFPNSVTNINGYTTPAFADSPPDYYVSFSTMTNYYVPSITAVTLAVDTNRTYYYVPYSNTLAVTIAGTNGMTSPVVWSFSAASAELGNSTAYKASYTNNCNLTPIPTGSYTVTFPAVAGWTAPSAVTTNITGAPLANSITGTYTVSTTSSTLTVRFQPEPAQTPARWWVYDNIALQGPYTNNYSKTLAVSNDYTVSYGAVRGYKYSTNTILTNFFGDLILTNTYVPYSNSLAVTIAGITTTTNVIWTLTGPTEFTNAVSYGTTFTNTFPGATPNTKTIASIPTGNYSVTFPTMAGYALSSANPQSTNITIASPLANSITGMYVYVDITSTNDSDGNGLPDAWEMQWFGHLTNDPYANPDGDWIPSSFTNFVVGIFITNNVATYTFSGNGYSSYPLQRGELLRHLITELPADRTILGYSKGVPFNNFLECRGLDGYYLTNGPNGTWVPNDDPLTNPNKGGGFPDGFDTQNTSGDADTKVSDGWKYYFW
ncbi:MAG: hypothetical protein Q8O57_05885, partial [Kiritimatiellota bacterium]|nr:hypothetical protein [Kiritimatiellota bacterium]